MQNEKQPTTDSPNQVRSSEESMKENAGQDISASAEDRDLSGLDRQEGDMDNGELGGNFRQQDQEKNQQENRS